ncbi:ABC transporter substrate-binding protein [Lacticaseibacillus yichunensis]|uniref:ABC transporter substrate-binding protein n=1 Tax=Lacticaseibacillus yichunensis TaxID=2486015 RepID=A0ABW4CTB9_9LACO|nr:ABC transporter substrate-binding protein [Lacticaseibacillus yichunensis]
MSMWRKGLALSAAAVCAVTLAACGNNSSSGSGSSSKKVVVTMYRPGDPLTNSTEMMKIVNKEIQKQYPNVELQIKPISWGDYGQKFSVMLTSGDGFDLAFANSYSANAQKGGFADMTELIKKYASKAYDEIDPAYWKGVTLDGKIYGFPTNANVFSQEKLVFNGTFTDKYNINVDNVDSLQTATDAMAAFKKADPSVNPMAIVKGYHAPTPGWSYPLSNGYPFVVDQSGKDTKVQNPYNLDIMRKNLATLHEWYQKGYVPRDAATSTTQYSLADDTWFGRIETTGPFDYGDTAILNARGGKPVVTKQISQPYKSTADAQMALYVISKASKHKKEAVEVLNAINTNKKIINTMVWGIEGKQWEFTDKAKGKIKTLPGYKQNTYYGAWMTGNNRNLYTLDSVTDKQIEERDQSIKDTPEAADLGFMPNLDKYKTELTNIANVMSKYSDIINTGTADPVPTINKMNAELKTAGWDTVAKELQSQYDKFLAAK